jgi:4-amino-4-deoxy-L-arabinose transferase-like glycosyltransferase
MSLKLETVITPLILALVMLATRFHHFGSTVNLPDASLAVFFLLGLLGAWRRPTCSCCRPMRS